MRDGIKSMIAMEPRTKQIAFQRIIDGRQTCVPNCQIPRHRHRQAYAAIVLTGAYEECGTCGRFFVRPGDVLLHGPFDTHLDRVQPRGAKILNLVLEDPVPAFGMGVIDDPDALVRCAEHDARQAAGLLKEQLRESRRAQGDWPDALASCLLADPDCRLGVWARQHGLAAETVSRGFFKVFGVTPASFRAEIRARGAFRRIVQGDASLASVAAACGFADQAHMSRAVRALTGSPPAAWRGSSWFKTAGGCGG